MTTVAGYPSFSLDRSLVLQTIEVAETPSTVVGRNVAVGVDRMPKGLDTILLLATIGMIFGAICGKIAERKGRSYGNYFALGFLFSLIGLFVVLVMDDRSAVASSETSRPVATMRSSPEYPSAPSNTVRTTCVTGENAARENAMPPRHVQRFCMCCGSGLAADSRYCAVCGTMVGKAKP